MTTFTISRGRVLAGILWLAVSCSVCARPTHGQDYQFGALFGGVPSQTRVVQGAPGQSVQLAAAFAAGVHCDYRFNFTRAYVPHIELEIMVLPPRNVRSTASAVPRNYSAVFATPGLRWEFLPSARLHPWMAVGAGYGLSLQSQVLTNGQPYSVHTKNGWSADYGGGLDYRVLGGVAGWSIRLRGQVREFISSNPELNVPLSSGFQRTLILGGGIVLQHTKAYLI